jgi:hypothetical protein
MSILGKVAVVAMVLAVVLSCAACAVRPGQAVVKHQSTKISLEVAKIILPMLKDNATANALGVQGALGGLDQLRPEGLGAAYQSGYYAAICDMRLMLGGTCTKFRQGPSTGALSLLSPKNSLVLDYSKGYADLNATTWTIEWDRGLGRFRMWPRSSVKDYTLRIFARNMTLMVPNLETNTTCNVSFQGGWTPVNWTLTRKAASSLAYKPVNMTELRFTENASRMDAIWR